MASTAQNKTATPGARLETSEPSTRPCPVDQVAPHKPSLTSQKPIPTASPYPDIGDPKQMMIILKRTIPIAALAVAIWTLVYGIAALGVAIFTSVYGVKQLYAAKAGNDENDAAHTALISAQLDANALALLTYCSEHKVSSDPQS